MSAQIYEPEGLNMPGNWNGWQNPPANNPALASSRQVPGGRISRIAVGIPRYHTIFRVAASGGDVIGGTYEWLFTSGPTTDISRNTWRATTVTMNTLQNYGFGGSGNNRITVRNGFWYTMNWADVGYAATRAIFMETNGEPVHITSVLNPGNQPANQSVTISITTDRVPSAEELFFVRYTTDPNAALSQGHTWPVSNIVPVALTGTSGIATIPGQAAGTLVTYYVFSTTVSNITAFHDLFTIRMNNNSGANYSYNVVAITWANMQHPPAPAILVGDSVRIYARVYADRITNRLGQGAGLSAWIGYNISNTNPATWSTWIPAAFAYDVGNNDEFAAHVGSSVSAPDTLYFASRFRLDGQAFVYGGYSPPPGGGFWDGTNFVSGVLTVNSRPLPIQLLFFDAAMEATKVRISWATATEINNDYFTVERSWNARDWSIVTTVQGAGNSNSVLHYRVNDYQPYPGISYYRLRQTDYDGAYEYFRIVAVNFIFATDNVRVFPNPATDRVYIFTDETDYTIVITDMYGKTVKGGFNQEVISTALLPGGVYILHIIYNCGHTVQNKVIINK